jgi:hypothetical protein
MFGFIGKSDIDKVYELLEKITIAHKYDVRKMFDKEKIKACLFATNNINTSAEMIWLDYQNFIAENFEKTISYKEVIGEIIENAKNNNIDPEKILGEEAESAYESAKYYCDDIVNRIEKGEIIINNSTIHKFFSDRITLILLKWGLYRNKLLAEYYKDNHKT